MLYRYPKREPIQVTVIKSCYKLFSSEEVGMDPLNSLNVWKRAGNVLGDLYHLGLRENLRAG